MKKNGGQTPLAQHEVNEQNGLPLRARGLTQFFSQPLRAWLNSYAATRLVQLPKPRRRGYINTTVMLFLFLEAGGNGHIGVGNRSRNRQQFLIDRHEGRGRRLIGVIVVIVFGRCLSAQTADKSSQ